jgi:hypothetical protein
MASDDYAPNINDPFAGAGTDPDDVNQGDVTGTEGQQDQGPAGGTD